MCRSNCRSSQPPWTCQQGNLPAPVWGPGAQNATSVVTQEANAEEEHVDSGGMTLPFIPMLLTFTSINYFVPMPAVMPSYYC